MGHIFNSKAQEPQTGTLEVSGQLDLHSEFWPKGYKLFASSNLRNSINGWSSGWRLSLEIVIQNLTNLFFVWLVGWCLAHSCLRQDSCYTAQSGLVIRILLPLPLECWDYRRSPPCSKNLKLISQLSHTIWKILIYRALLTDRSKKVQVLMLNKVSLRKSNLRLN